MKAIATSCVAGGGIAFTLACSLVSGSLAPTASQTPVPSTEPAPTVVSARSPTATPAPRPTPTLQSLTDRLRAVVAIEDVLPGDVQRLQPAPGGGLWLITDQAVARVQDDIASVYLSDAPGTLAGIDADERVWVVAEDTRTISAWDGTSWQEYGAGDGWAPIQLEDDWHRDAGWGQSDAQGNFWLATSQDVRLFDGEGWTVFTPDSMGMHDIGPEDLWAIFTLGISQDTSTVWVGECDWGGPGPSGGQGVRWFDGSAWHGADSPVASGCASAIATDLAGGVWLGLGRTLWITDDGAGEWSSLGSPGASPDGGRPGYAEAIFADPSGEAWPVMGLCGGASCSGGSALYHLQAGAWTPIGPAAEFGSPYHLVFDADGVPWLLWDGGLYRLLGDTPEAIGDLAPVALGVDNAGQVWFVAPSEGRAALWTFDE